MYGKDFGEHIYDDFRSSSYTALTIVESTDITSEAQLLLYAKFACGCHTVEELLCCLTLHSTTTGHDICFPVDAFFTENQFDWGRLVVLHRRRSIDDGKKYWISTEVDPASKVRGGFQ